MSNTFSNGVFDAPLNTTTGIFSGGVFDLIPTITSGGIFNSIPAGAVVTHGTPIGLLMALAF